MRIRELNGRDDVRAIDRVNRRAWRVAYEGIVPRELLDRAPPDDAAVDERLALFESWSGVRLVAETETEAGPRVVGYGFARWGDDTKEFVADGDAGLKEIYVDPDYWNEGVGTALLERMERRVPDGYAGLTLSTLADNDVARAFYERRGFQQVGEWTEPIAGVPYDCLLYRKPL